MRTQAQIDRAIERNKLAHQVVADLLAANAAEGERHCIRCIRQAIAAAQEYEQLMENDK